MLKGHLLSERYKIKETIGGGGMANVYLARDIILDRDVAIKVLRLEYANDEEFIARFDREAKAATSLSHPNIVNIYDVGEEDHILYMAMEYVDGLTLKEYIQQNRPIDVEESLDIMKQITSAIAHAHANDIVHRDIKPQNILIDKFGNVKVTDFGIAVALSATSLTQTNSILGSVHYLSPEQARGGMATKKSDIYSLGIVFFELLTGKLPFSGQTPVSIALKHLQSETPSVRQYNELIPQSVENIVLKATAKDPFHRFETVYDMEDALVHALDPHRLNEAIYEPPVEAGEETKAIPIITDEQFSNLTEDTIVHNTQSTKVFDREEKPSENKKKNRKKLWWWVGSISFILITAAVLALFILPDLLRPKEVEVPDVIGYDYRDAVRELESLNLEVEQEWVYSEDIEEDLVERTDPRPGRHVKEQSIVTLFISQGEQPIVFADYVGRDFNQVERLLQDLGFSEEDIMVIEKPSDEPTGQIIAQIQPKPDQEVIPDETQIIFEVSSGPPLISLNNLVGNTREEAEDYLDSRGLVMKVIEENSEEIPEGQVIRHDPGANTEVEEGATIDVYISIGPEEKPPIVNYVTFTVPYVEPTVDQPDQGENNDDDAENAETSEPEPQHVLIYIEDMNHRLSEVYQEDWITENKEYTITLTIEPNSHGTYRVIRDGNVIIDKQIAYEDEEGD